MSSYNDSLVIITHKYMWLFIFLKVITLRTALFKKNY